MSSGRGRTLVAVAGVAAVAVAAMVAGVGVGAVPIPVADVVTGLVDGNPLIWRYRLPRVAIGAIAGSCMAMSGVVLQTSLRNPLAAPDLVGVTSGGGLASALVLLSGAGTDKLALTPAALAGSLLGGVLTLAVAGRRRGDPLALALCGLAVSVGLGALTTMVLVRAAPEAGAALAWLKGSLYARGAADLATLTPWFMVGLLLVALSPPGLDRLRLDDTTLGSLGVAVGRTRITMVLLGSLLAAVAVAGAGVLAFVGLVVPHLARMLVGTRAVPRLVVSGLGGAALVVFADAAGRVLVAPTEIPAGAVAATLGAPYFIWLLIRADRHGKDM